MVCSAMGCTRSMNLSGAPSHPWNGWARWFLSFWARHLDSLSRTRRGWIGALYLAAIFLVDSAPKNSFMQIVRAAGLTAMAVVGIAAILPLGTLIEQSKEYIAIFGTTHPLHFSFIDQQLVFLKSAWLWLVCGAILAFILFSRRGGKSASNRLTVLVCIVVPIISAVILVRTMSRLDEFSIGSATGTLAFCALSLACLRKEAAPRLIAFFGGAALIPL